MFSILDLWYVRLRVTGSVESNCCDRMCSDNRSAIFDFTAVIQEQRGKQSGKD